MAQMPESIHNELHFQREVLRALLDRLARAAERILRGEPAVQELRDAQRTLHEVLEIHLRQEEAMLGPLLRTRWTSERTARLRAEHCSALQALQAERSRGARESAAASRLLVRRMLAAMAAEERDLDGGERRSGSAPP